MVKKAPDQHCTQGKFNARPGLACWIAWRCTCGRIPSLPGPAHRPRPVPPPVASALFQTYHIKSIIKKRKRSFPTSSLQFQGQIKQRTPRPISIISNVTNYHLCLGEQAVCTWSYHHGLGNVLGLANKSINQANDRSFPRTCSESIKHQTTGCKL